MARARARSVIEDGRPPAAPDSRDEITRCLVYCRVRPSFTRDFEDGAFPLLTMTGKKVVVKDERTYEYDGTFQGDSKQMDVFRSVALPCIQHAFKGFCSALMCYGQTGTGKSFTMCCTKPGLEGIIPQAAINIFETIRRDPSKSYTVTAEFIQIYRDQLGDLMTEGGKDRVDIHWDQEKGVTLPGCTTHELRSAEEFMAFYNEGDKRRVVMATAMNPESSRGHTALVVRIASQSSSDELSGTTSGKITFIDLAGYERFSKTGISNANPIMKDEAKTINASLLSLGHVVTSLSNGDKHIPWRNSKLTRLLQDSIGGRSRTTIILTVGPSSDHLHESTNTLQFGMRAMAVKVQAKATLTVDYEKLAARLQAMLDEKNARISDLEIQVAANSTDRQALLECHRRDTEDLESQHKAALEIARRDGASADQILNITEQLTLEAAALKEQQEEEVTYHEEQHERDMIELFTEEKKRATRSLEQEKMARERAVADLQSRLDEARGGGNTDLERTLHELAARDVMLATRAVDIARLQDRCTQLLQQLREAGVEPVEVDDEGEDGWNAVVDVSLVEDLKRRYESELNDTRNQVADLRAALEEAAGRAKARGDEAEILRRTVQDLRTQQANAAIDSLLAASPTSVAASNAKQSAAVDEFTQPSLLPEPSIDVEALKASLQSDIDFWRSRASTLQEEVDEMKRDRASHLHNTPRGARGAKPDATITGKAAVDLALQLERLKSENTLLLEQTASFSDLGEGPAKSVDRLRQLLANKDAQIEDVMSLAQQRERHVAELKRQVQALRHQPAAGGSANEDINGVNDSLANASMFGPASVSLVGPVDNVSITQFTDMLNRLRARNSELECLILGDATPEALDAMKTRDDELKAKDSIIMEQATEIQALTAAVARLEKQVEDLHETPVARLSADKRANIEALIAEQMREMEERHAELQADLERRAAEKQKVAALLQTLNHDRMQEAALYQQKQAELEEQVKASKSQLESRDHESAARLADIAAQQRKEQDEAETLRRVLQEQTRQMMDAQARLAMEREEVADGGLLSRLKRKFR
jgi:chromosome segregation ATPase